METGLTSQEASLLQAFRKLPPETAAEVSRLVERSAAVAPKSEIDWADSWSDQDLNDFRSASLRQLDQLELEQSDRNLATSWSLCCSAASRRGSPANDIWLDASPRLLPSVAQIRSQ